MRIKLNSLINKHPDKIAIVTGLGPSLREILPFLNDPCEDIIIISPNLFPKMVSFKANYWIVANNLHTIAKYHQLYNSQKDFSTFLFAGYIKGFTKPVVEQFLSKDLKYIPYDNEPTIVRPEKYSSPNNTWGMLENLPDLFNNYTIFK